MVDRSSHYRQIECSLYRIHIPIRSTKRICSFTLMVNPLVHGKTDQRETVSYITSNQDHYALFRQGKQLNKWIDCPSRIEDKGSGMYYNQELHRTCVYTLYSFCSISRATTCKIIIIRLKYP